MRTIPSSELIINSDGSIFHLHLKPEQLADIVILVGDPGRVAMIADYFETKECEVANREFLTVTGTYKGKRMTVMSTGIGIGNIDISVTELDALANVDFETRQAKEQFRQLTLVRLGTSGAIQQDIEVGEVVFSRTSLGFDVFSRTTLVAMAYVTLPSRRHSRSILHGTRSSPYPTS